MQGHRAAMQRLKQGPSLQTPLGHFGSNFLAYPA
jgi:hypothetical protein